jgi:hypothetical protein
MKTTLDLPAALVDEVKLRARHEGRKLNEAMADLLRKGLAASEFQSGSIPRRSIKINLRSGLPYIECPPNAPASHMTTTELVELEQNIVAGDDRERISHYLPG